MLDGSKIQELVEGIDAESIRVYAPTSMIFLCGGQVDAEKPHYLSLRSAFLRFAYDPPYENHHIVLAEELNFVFPNDHYDNILLLEADMAQIADLIVLFSESFGSVAELGAFAMINQIASNLLVFVDDKNYNADSFIKLGPILSLEKMYGDGAVCVLTLEDLSIDDIANVKNLNLNIFKARANAAIDIRLKETRAHTTLNKKNEGHIIKLVVGMIQHYGALTLSEIKMLLECLDINHNDKRIHQFLQCALFAKWIIKDKRGLRTFYSALPVKSSIGYSFSADARTKNRERWRSDVRTFFKNHDPDRFNSISFALKDDQQ
ncbi:hypothetical protein FV218_12595 [Methylobacterium sp. WL69]|uniref:retron St85 family effector protein n=1 Tax=Methylobacterium sp. WL69 TaxID=2603893 RepID=UPI0011CB4FB3|nr:retron St85 family effector protein [Methylobacterium sp. WL69]TXM72835.1 hypothetical protein FV218_12595 [Methylobacterium sp. WL69]